MGRPRWKVCACTSCDAHPGSCPELTQGRHCGACAGQCERRRGTRQARGYGAEHDARRRALLDAGHSTNLRDDPTAVADQLECRTCNRGWRRAQ